MCGIAGILLNKSNKKLIEKFQKISDDLSHRGPDSSSFYKNSKNLFLHTRLSIIDLKGGNQPIINNDLILIANGEIYNDPEIRSFYKTYNFKTESDSESIMTLYDREGINGLEKLRGMYAFAIYDKKKNCTVLGRDIFGIKPLYFSIIKDGIIFSSEITPLINSNLIKKKISEEKLIEYLELQYTTGKKTIYKDVFRLRPGEILTIQNGKIINSKLQKLSSLKKKSSKVDNNFIEKKLEESVSAHLRSDVPYCLFFSGGIDSMLVMYFMSKLNLGSKIEAFKVNIDDRKNKSNNIFLKKISNQYKIRFNEINFTEDDFWNIIPFAAKKIDDPIADYAILPTFKLAEIASKKFKVAITGEGGDELFGGYGRYRHNNFLNKKFFKGAFRNLGKFKNNYWKFETNQTFIDNLSLTKVQKKQFFDYNNWLPNNLLVKLDRCLMSYGMEGRTPLIDKKLFESFFFVRDEYKIRNGFGKFLIRNFIESKVKYYDAFTKKEGFTVPIEKWLPKHSKFFLEFLPKIQILRIFFNENEIKDLCKSISHNKKAIRGVWHMIFISAWYYVTFKKVKTDGNFFDIISTKVN